MEAKKIEHEKVTITFREDGILELDYKDGELTLEDSKSIFRITRANSPWKLAPLFIKGGDFLNQSKESRNFNGSDEVMKYSSAIAFLSDNLAKKLLANFFILFFKKNKPMQFFANEAEAIKWLKQFKRASINEPDLNVK